MKKPTISDRLSDHALGGFLGPCEGPTSVGQPALGLEPASILNELTIFQSFREFIIKHIINYTLDLLIRDVAIISIVDQFPINVKLNSPVRIVHRILSTATTNMKPKLTGGIGIIKSHSMPFLWSRFFEPEQYQQGRY